MPVIVLLDYHTLDFTQELGPTGRVIERRNLKNDRRQEK
jgi:hypothetical protein